MNHLKSATWLAVLGGVCWILLLAPLPEPFVAGRAWALPVTGVVIQFLIVAALIQTRTAQAVPEHRRDASIAVALAGAALLAAVVLRRIEIVTALLLFVCGSAVLLLVAAAIEELRAGRSVEVTTHSGGLGGSVGGWKVSPVAVMTVLIVILVGAIVTLAPDSQAAGDATAGNAASNASSANNQAAPREAAAQPGRRPAATPPATAPGASGGAGGVSNPGPVPAPAPATVPPATAPAGTGAPSGA